jgi:hypothetical protein
MILTELQVLSDAGELVTDLITSLDAEDLSYEQKAQAMEGAKRIFGKAALVLGVMLEDSSVDDKPIH